MDYLKNARPKLDPNMVKTLSVSVLTDIRKFTIYNPNLITGQAREIIETVFGGKDISAADHAQILEELERREMQAEYDLGQLETSVFAKKGTLEWIDGEKLEVRVKLPSQEAITTRYVVFPVKPPVDQREGLVRLASFLVGLFHIDKGNLVMVMNPTHLQAAKFQGLRPTGIGEVHAILKTILTKHGSVGALCPTRKGYAFFSLLLGVLTTLPLADYIALEQFVARKGLSQQDIVSFRDQAWKSGARPFLMPVNCFPDGDSVRALAVSGFDPLVYISSGIPSRHEFVQADGAFESAVAAYTQGTALRGSPEAGTTALFMGRGFSGHPSRQVRDVLSLAGVVSAFPAKLDVIVDGMTPGILPTAAETAAGYTKSVSFKISPSDYAKVPAEYEKYILKGKVNAAVRVLFLGETLNIQLKTMVTQQEALFAAYGFPFDSHYVTIGRQIPHFAAGDRKVFCYVYREPFDFCCICSTIELVRFGDLKLSPVKDLVEFYKEVVKANRFVNAFWLNPVTHKNVALSNMLKRPIGKFLINRESMDVEMIIENLDRLSDVFSGVMQQDGYYATTNTKTGGAITARSEAVKMAEPTKAVDDDNNIEGLADLFPVEEKM